MTAYFVKKSPMIWTIELPVWGDDLAVDYHIYLSHLHRLKLNFFFRPSIFEGNRVGRTTVRYFGPRAQRGAQLLLRKITL
jgi:hypothetical protein